MAGEGGVEPPILASKANVLNRLTTLLLKLADSTKHPQRVGEKQCCLLNLERNVGIEPTTCTLATCRSTAELIPQ